ncbi:MAG: hypothetical protein LQ342_007572 [Letrouitia transgressa]|nr:MAG: hypothetical protein LQ342_007572 [Letrouitia transgressa]
MPSRVRQVDFAPIPAYSRLPHDDELYVMKAFARHASHCPQCIRPYEVHRQGGTLCSKGHARALDVAQYIYNKGGQSFSLIDREGNNRVQVEIPANCEAVRSLLKAMERGLRLRRKVQPVSYDETYLIQPRTLPSEHGGGRTTSRREPRYIRKPSLETAEPPPSKSYSGRGSLWEQDQRERERRHRKQQPPIYIHAAPRNPPPVPPKEAYWR